MLAPTDCIERAPRPWCAGRGNPGVTWWTKLRKMSMFLVVSMTGHAVDIQWTAVDGKFLNNKEYSQTICTSATEEKYWWMISAKNAEEVREYP